MLTHVKDALCVMLGSKAHTMTAMAASVASAVLYGATSISMAFLNKIVLDVYAYNYPLVIMTLQMAVTFFILKSLSIMNCITLKKLSREELLRFVPPCFFYSLNGIMSLAALTEMNLTMYSLLKRNGPLVTLILSSIFLKKGMPARFVLIGILLMSAGCIIAAEGDMSFDLAAYAYGIGSVLSQSIYLILLQRLGDNHSTADILYMNSVLSFPVLLVIAGAVGEFSKAYTYAGYVDPGFVVSFMLTLIMGSFLNFTLFLCNNNNSAVTTSVVGTLKSVAQTTMGLFTFGGVVINGAMLSGITMNMTGGIIYTYAKYLEGERKRAMKRMQSAVNLDEAEKGSLRHNNNLSEGYMNGDTHSDERRNRVAENITHLHQGTKTDNNPERIL